MLGIDVSLVSARAMDSRSVPWTVKCTHSTGFTLDPRLTAKRALDVERSCPGTVSPPFPSALLIAGFLHDFAAVGCREPGEPGVLDMRLPRRG